MPSLNASELLELLTDDEELPPQVKEQSKKEKKLELEKRRKRQFSKHID